MAELRSLDEVLAQLKVAPAATQQAAAARMRTWLRESGAGETSGVRPVNIASPIKVCMGLCIMVGSLLLAASGLSGQREPCMVRPRPTVPVPLSNSPIRQLADGRRTAQRTARTAAGDGGSAQAQVTGAPRQVPRVPALLPRPERATAYPQHDAFSSVMDAVRKQRPEAKTSDFPLILCVGHGKTATKSLNKAMFMLGMKTAHFYGAGVYGLLYNNVAEKARHDFLFDPDPDTGRHVDAVLDTPVVDFYQEILLAYPNAKVILTIRQLDSWLRSQQKFYCCYARGCKNWLEPWRRGSNLVFGTECPSTVQAVKRYVQHNRNVYDSVPHDRLLVMDIPGGDGWEKLCAFLGVAVPPPNMTFPSRH